MEWRTARGGGGNLHLISCRFVGDRLEELVHNILSLPLVLITLEEMSSVRIQTILFRLQAAEVTLMRIKLELSQPMAKHLSGPVK